MLWPEITKASDSWARVSSALAVGPEYIAIVACAVVVHMPGGGRGGVSPDTFTANWLHVQGRGREGGVSLDTFTGKCCGMSEGKGGRVCADTRLPIN